MPDDDADEKVGVMPGKIEILEDFGFGRYAAVLWVPDPEQRRGWREYYVRRDRWPPMKPGKRLGF